MDESTLFQGHAPPALFRVRAALRRLGVALEADEPRPGVVRLACEEWGASFYDAAKLAEGLDGIKHVLRDPPTPVARWDARDRFYAEGGFWDRIKHAMLREGP